MYRGIYRVMYRVIYRVIYRVMYRVMYRGIYRVIYRGIYRVMYRGIYRVMYRVIYRGIYRWMYRVIYRVMYRGMYRVMGDIQGDVQGDIQGDVQGDVQGDIQGDVQGDIQGDVQGGVQGDIQGDIGRVDQISKIPDEKTGSQPLKHSGVIEGTDISKDMRKRIIPESLDRYTDPTPVRGTGDEEPIGYSAHSESPNEWGEPLKTDGKEDTEDEDVIMVGVVGSAAPWFLTGWSNDVEVEFMIDTGCQVTILATSVFEKMCKVHPQVKDRLSPCTCRLVSADSSPLTVVGRINLNVVFPGLQCNMCCVVANIGSDGLLGTEALQSCLPHQLDMRTGQLWAEGRSKARR